MIARTALALLVVSDLALASACDKKRSAPDDPPADPAAARTEPAARTAPPRPAGASTWVELAPTAPIASSLASQAAEATTAGRTPVAYLHADWCDPCVAIERTRSDPMMMDAFAGTHVIAIDIDAAPAKELTALGLDFSSIPAFYKLDAAGKVTAARIDGGAWGDNIPANMAPPLKAFFAR